MHLIYKTINKKRKTRNFSIIYIIKYFKIKDIISLFIVNLRFKFLNYIAMLIRPINSKINIYLNSLFNMLLTTNITYYIKKLLISYINKMLYFRESLLKL